VTESFYNEPRSPDQGANPDLPPVVAAHRAMTLAYLRALLALFAMFVGTGQGDRTPREGAP
jgi:hypothetical protein